MPRSIVRLLVLSALVTATPAAAQWRVPIALEAQGGYSIPRGEFGKGETGARPLAGPRVSLGGRISLTRTIAVYGSYLETRFGCANCGALELKDSMISRGGEIGIDLRPLPARYGVRPWLRGAAVYQTLGLSDGEETMTSGGALGFGVGAGLSLPVLGLLELMPGLRFDVVAAGFEFSAGPTRSLDVRALTLELGAAFHLGGQRE